MRYTVGIDLGSTTTKAVVLDDNRCVLGRGITNSRSNYKVACDVALREALNSARFGLISAELAKSDVGEAQRAEQLVELDLRFREQQYRAQLARLGDVLARLAGGDANALGLIADVIERMSGESRELFTAGANRKSDFFRDLAGSRYLPIAEELGR